MYTVDLLIVQSLKVWAVYQDFLTLFYGRKTFGLCSEAQLFLAKGSVHYTMDIEAKVIQPAQVLVDVSSLTLSFYIDAASDNVS